MKICLYLGEYYDWWMLSSFVAHAHIYYPEFEAAHDYADMLRGYLIRGDL